MTEKPEACIHDPDEDTARLLHWAENPDGSEERIDCGCPCPDCRAY